MIDLWVIVFLTVSFVGLFAYHYERWVKKIQVGEVIAVCCSFVAFMGAMAALLRFCAIQGHAGAAGRPKAFLIIVLAVDFYLFLANLNKGSECEDEEDEDDAGVFF
jgi:hypothetical protein